MLILNMGIPRSGTTWAFNVFRHILDRRGLAYDIANPSGGPAVDAVLASVAPRRNMIVHFHEVTENVIQRAGSTDCAAFFNVRDPRDVVVSQMHLHDAGLAEAIKMTMAAFWSLQQASGIPDLMLIPYEHIKDHAEALIYQMALRIGHFISPREAAEIAELTSIGKHREKMQQVAQRHGEPESGVKRVFSGWRHVKYDESSLITDKHIQSGETGRWKKELDPQQQEELNKAFASILKQLGFVEK